MSSLIDTIAFSADTCLIQLYRLTDIPFVAYLIGTFLLAFLCVITGEITISLALKWNRRHIEALNRETREKERLSMQAYQAGDRAGYKALNKEATEAWGKKFFTMVAYSAGILWPIPFALGWMQTRFMDVPFPLAYPLSVVFGETVGYPFTFIPIYILCRILFKYMRPHLPYFRNV